MATGELSRQFVALLYWSLVFCASYFSNTILGGPGGKKCEQRNTVKCPVESVKLASLCMGLCYQWNAVEQNQIQGFYKNTDKILLKILLSKKELQCSVLHRPLSLSQLITCLFVMLTCLKAGFLKCMCAVTSIPLYNLYVIYHLLCLYRINVYK